ncbi:MAG: hypothetical protein JW888_06420 [Pirellulales bacterium]|nr:hypothetical protein [Pirellulales bacterium]
MKTARFLGLAILVAVASSGTVAWGQYTRFPSAVAGETVPPPPGVAPVISGEVAGPLPTVGGTVVTPAPNWDPYAPPGVTQSPSPLSGASQAPTLLPQDYYPPVPALPDTGRLQRLIDELRLDYDYLAPRGSKSFGTNDLELSATFAFPFLYNQETPLFITPGFAFHWWQGPNGPDLPPGLLSNMPARVYDAYLDAAWNPQIPGTPVGGELAFRVGVYSDLDRVTGESLRYTGHGLMVLSLSPAFKIKAGVVYLDRVRIKILPAGGIVWTPNPDTQFQILFPNPRIARRLANYNTTEWWLYCRGEYGGGSWIIKPDGVPGPLDQVDYNDLRFAIGLEFDRMDKIGGLVEVGTAFDRELVVRSTGDKYSPSTTIFLRAGLIR